MREIGIYCIVSLKDTKRYVGFSSNLEDRENTHFKALGGNYHINKHLQSAWNKYGEENFEFFILEYCIEEELFKKEHFWATLLRTHNRKWGYNIEPTSENGRFHPRSQETKDLLKLKNSGRKLSPEQIDKIKTARARQIITEEHKRNISKGHKGKTISKKTKRKMSESYKWRNTKNHGKSKRKTVYQYNLEGKLIRIWESIAEIYKTKLFTGSQICKACNSTNGRYKGYIWSYNNLLICDTN